MERFQLDMGEFGNKEQNDFNKQEQASLNNS
jgi:hypothetical protein